MIYTLGETVFDIVFRNMNPITAKVGGSALNTAVSLAHLGASVSFVSEMGTDTVGKHCKEFLKQQGVNTSYISTHSTHPTSLALAFLNQTNDAQYQFYKQLPKLFNCKPLQITHKDIVLFSSSFAISERTRESLLQILYTAQLQKSLIVYDPNIRSQVHARSTEMNYIEENFSKCHIVRASDEDCAAIFGHTNTVRIYKELQSKGVQICIITKNSKTVELFTPTFVSEFDVPEIIPVSTIGAGDTFNAGIIYALYKYGITYDTLNSTPLSFWVSAIHFAIACATTVCMSLDNYIDKQNTRELLSIIEH